MSWKFSAYPKNETMIEKIKNQIIEKDLLWKMSQIRKIIGYPHPLFTSEISKAIEDCSKMKINEWFEWACFRFTRKKTYVEVKAVVSWRIKTTLSSSITKQENEK